MQPLMGEIKFKIKSKTVDNKQERSVVRLIEPNRSWAYALGSRNLTMLPALLFLYWALIRFQKPFRKIRGSSWRKYFPIIILHSIKTHGSQIIQACKLVSRTHKIEIQTCDQCYEREHPSRTAVMTDRVVQGRSPWRREGQFGNRKLRAR